MSWDESVYAGVRQFQHAKGFDPYTQDAARQLNHPLYRLRTDTDDAFSYAVNGELENESDDADLVVTTDPGSEDQDDDWDTKNCWIESQNAAKPCEETPPLL
ncbi:hypothetical protein C8R45DRAFT_1214711 [Mycena sanguinolenta]|nr:hypothetical protein C8R45DRAFT_1214711 [Mycena sanguinolenta]